MTKIRDIFNKSLKNYADTRELDYKKAVYDSLGKEIDVADLDDLFEQATEALEEMTRVGTYIVEIPNYEELSPRPRTRIRQNLQNDAGRRRMVRGSSRGHQQLVSDSRRPKDKRLQLIEYRRLCLCSSLGKELS